MSHPSHAWLVAGLLSLTLAGCSGGSRGSGDEIPTFTLAWSEYPSWSAFDVASRRGLIDGAKGKLGPIEKKWNVDIELQQLDYDPCIASYATGKSDAVCITNIDVIPQSISRTSVAIMPTSTSNGADACIVVGIDDVKQLRDKKVHGLEKSVSQFAFVRGLQKLGEKEADYTFANMDPAAASLAVQQGNADVEAIMVWNPFVLDTLRKRPEAKVLFSSADISGEILDMVVIGDDSLAKPGGEDFCCAVIDAYYQVNQIIEDPKTRDEALVQIGEKFSSLGLEDMKEVVEQTKFYKTADEGIAVFEGDELLKTMDTVTTFCRSHAMPESGDPTYSIGPLEPGRTASLRFDSSFMTKVKEAAGKGAE